MIKQIADSDLTPEDLPEPGDVDGVIAFALSFNGYEYFGGIHECAKAARQRRRESLSDLRNELFFTARVSHHGSATEPLMAVYEEILPLIRKRLNGDAIIDRQQAELIADRHIATLDDPQPGYRFSRGEPVVVGPGRYSGCWCFEYRVICDLDIPEDEQEIFFGAIGFVVDNQTGEVSILCGADWGALDLSK